MKCALNTLKWFVLSWISALTCTVIFAADGPPVTDNWPETGTLPSPDATQAAAADEHHVYAVSNTRVAVHDRVTGELVTVSDGEAQHLNSAFLLDGKLYCAHSNYPRVPERSELRVFDPKTRQLETFHDFGESNGSLTWSVFHDSAWWCHFAFYGAENHRSHLIRFDAEWRENGRWTFPESVISQLGNYSLSGGLWHGNELLVTGHDDPLVFRLTLPTTGSELVHTGTDAVPFTGQGIAFDPASGGLVGINRGRRTVVMAAPPKTRPLRLRVLSYNIHHGEGMDQVLDLDRICRVIREVNPDLVSVQEVDRRVRRTNSIDQPAELGKGTRMEAVFGGNISLQGGEYGNVVLTRLPLIAHENIRLPNIDDGEQRGLLMTRIRLPDDRPALWFLATHFDHRRDGRERLDSAGMIRGLIEQAGSNPVILAGDLNERRENSALSELLKSFTMPHHDELPTIPVVSPAQQIDFILIRPENRWRTIETRVLDESVASDHRAILAVLELLPDAG